MQRLKKSANFVRSGLLLALALSLTAVVVRAQNSVTGEIKGTVTDSSGAVVAGASVSIKNMQTGLVTPTTSNQDGLFDVPFLAPGNYTITFSKQGFRDFVRQGVALQVETLAIDASLQVGTATQEVVVTGAAPLVQTETTEQHIDLNTAEVAAAPIVGYDWRSELVQLIPGINTGGGAGSTSGQASGVNGSQGYNINFMVDGAAATSPRDYNNSNNFTPVDSIAEVNVDSANAPPQYGNGFASVNEITKSGTNQWHGAGFEYVQNTLFNARGFFNETGAKTVSHYNLFGGDVGGPIIKNKLFFFFTFQDNPYSNATQGFYTYPTAAMEAGDFYGNALTTVPVGCAGCTTTSIPAGNFDAVASKLQAYFPAATASGWAHGCPGPVNVGPTVAQTCTEINDFSFADSVPGSNKWYQGKVDYDINSKMKLSASFNYFPVTGDYILPDPLYPSLASAVAPEHNYNLDGQLSFVWTISPTLINEFRIGEGHETDDYIAPSLGKNAPTLVGIEPTYGGNAPGNVFPNITVQTGAGDGASYLGADNGNGNINALLSQVIAVTSDIVTLVHGRHTIKIGGEFDRSIQNYTNWGDTNSGNFNFNGGVTGVPYADFLLGDVYSWSTGTYDPTSARSWNSAVFANDDFKLSSHVTLNLGLRWQMQSGWWVLGGLFGEYDPILPNTAAGAGDLGAILYGGQSDAAYGGSINNLTTIQNADNHEFAPRIGIAWSPGEKWAIRASYGVFDAPRDAENYTDGALGLGFDPHNVGFNGGVNGAVDFKLAVGPPAGTVIYPTAATLSPALENGGSVTYYPRNMPTVYTQQVLFDIQHQFVGGIMLDAGYVYTRGSHLNFQTDVDQATPSQFAHACTSSNPACDNPIPWFSSINEQLYDGWSNYNALQLRLQKRMSNGLNFQVNYTFSKSLDTGTGNGHGSGIDTYQSAFNPVANYGLSDFNSTHYLSGQIVWEPPVGAGRRFALHGVADEVLGGWRVSSVFQWHTGVPFSPVIQGSVADGIDPGLDQSFNDGSKLYPNLVGNPVLSNPTMSQWFNPAAYANPTSGTLGDTGRNTLIGPGFSDVDLSIGKDFPLHIREGMMIQIRADMTNLFNHPSFANPDANVGYNGSVLADGNAGKITGLTSNSRVIQLGAHFTF
jgi:hypothetical protein